MIVQPEWDTSLEGFARPLLEGLGAQRAGMGMSERLGMHPFSLLGIIGIAIGIGIEKKQKMKLGYEKLVVSRLSIGSVARVFDPDPDPDSEEAEYQQSEALDAHPSRQ
jgi:hypothetical protein